MTSDRITPINAACRLELDSQATAPTPVPCESTRHYVVVRADLPIGLAGAMIVHAAGETGPADPGTIAVVLQVADEVELRALASMCRRSHLIIEADGEHAGHAMAFAIPPGPKQRSLGHLRLWRCATS